MKNIGYIGTYGSCDEDGIYRFELDDDGKFHHLKLMISLQETKYMSIEKDRLATLFHKGDHAGVKLFNLHQEELIIIDEVLDENKTSCFIAQRGTNIYTGNYHEGSVSIYEICDDNLKRIKRLELGLSAGCHQIVFHQSCIMIPCLHQDRIVIYDQENDCFLEEMKFDTGIGPRHMIFDEKHEHLYVLSELSNQLFHFEVVDNQFKLIDCLTLSNSQESSSAALRLSPDEKYLYTSIRGINRILVVKIENSKMSIIQDIDSGGNHPRDMEFSKDSRYLVVVHKDDDQLVSFKRDEIKGILSEKVDECKIHQGVCVTFL